MGRKRIILRYMCDYCPRVYDEEAACVTHEGTHGISRRHTTTVTPIVELDAPIVVKRRVSWNAQLTKTKEITPRPETRFDEIEMSEEEEETPAPHKRPKQSTRAHNAAPSPTRRPITAARVSAGARKSSSTSKPVRQIAANRKIAAPSTPTSVVVPTASTRRSPHGVMRCEFCTKNYVLRHRFEAHVMGCRKRPKENKGE